MYKVERYVEHDGGTMVVSSINLIQKLTLTDVDTILNEPQTNIYLSNSGLIFCNTARENAKYYLLGLAFSYHPSLMPYSVNSNVHFLNMLMRVEHARVHFVSAGSTKLQNFTITIKARHFDANNRHDKRGTIELAYDLTGMGLKPISPWHPIMGVYELKEEEK